MNICVTGWKHGASEESENDQIVKVSECCAGAATRVLGVTWEVIRPRHLTERLRTLSALCSGMLVLEAAATTKIKLGYFHLSPGRKSPHYLGSSHRSPGVCVGSCFKRLLRGKNISWPKLLFRVMQTGYDFYMFFNINFN